MEIIHVTAECYPMAKAGGLADVVGALPKYQQELGYVSKVVMPMHRTKFLYENEWDVVHKGTFFMGSSKHDFTIIREKSSKLGFDLYCVDIFGLLDRENIYRYQDDSERFTAFQIAVLEWILSWSDKPDVVHVHDHHTALIPFMMQHCYQYRKLAHIKTVLTIHNAQYQGWMSWDKTKYLPEWDSWKWGLLEWNNLLNPLAAGIKCAHRVTTVSPGYMEEIKSNANGLEYLIRAESKKCSGIINGIDYAVWNSNTDAYLTHQFAADDVDEGKKLNKKYLCEQFGFDLKLPLFVFIGRLVGEKAADLLPESIRNAFEQMPLQFNFLILGNGEHHIENDLRNMQHQHVGYYNSQITYNEKLSHNMYAGADFLLMPSRVEPCGLNQLYAMRYGTVPVVRRTGGLQDTVIDFGDKNGYGICFNNASVTDILLGLKRAVSLYKDKITLHNIRKRMMAVETSWENSASEYIQLYQSI
jgi:starch synthase